MKRFLLTFLLALATVFVQGQYQIPVQPYQVFNLNGVKTKDIVRLFDGDLNTQLSTDQVTDFRTTNYMYDSWVVLDSVYNITEVKYRVANTNGTVMSVAFYDANRTQVGDTAIIDISGYLEWKTVTASRNAVRFIQIRGFGNITFVSDGLREVQLYGTSTGAASTIWPSATINAVTDLGVYAIGINTIGDRLNKIDAVTGDTVMKKATKAARFYWTGSDFDKYPETYDNRLLNGPIYLGRYGTNHSGNLLDQFKRWDIKPMMTMSGGSIKWLNTTEANQNTSYLGGTSAQLKKYIETTANPEMDSSWNGLAERYYNLIALYGNNASADMTGKSILNGTTTLGQNTMDIFEWDNEASRWWQQDYYHSPKMWYKAIKNVYARGKQADANAPIFAAALPGIDTVYWRAVYFYHYLENGTATAFPADGFNFNHYINNLKTEQGGGGDTYAISPEKWQTLQEVQTLKNFFNRVFPNKKVQWTEFGFATDDGSPYDVNPIGAKTDRQVQADWMLRMKAIVQTQSFIERMYWYAWFEDGTGPFNSMAMIKDNFNASSVYLNSTVYPVGYAQAQEIYTERNFKFFSTIVTDGDSTSHWVTRKDHLSDANKKLYKVWRGTDNGSTGSVTLTVTGATAAKLYTLRYDSYLPDSSNLTITANQVTFTASEAMQWVEVTTSGTANNPPIANAGTDQSITLPISQVTVVGSGTDGDGTIASYSWTKTVGGAATITSPSASTTTITGLVAGSYTFRLTVTDDDGATAFDDINVTVNPAGPITGDTIYLADVRRTYIPTNGTSQLYAVIYYKDNTVDYIYQKPSSVETVNAVRKRNKVINGASRIIAILRYTDGTSQNIEYKIY